jgi:cysteine desulfurase
MSYLDHNATTPLLRGARDAIERASEEAWANPASAHAWGRHASAILEAARGDVAALVGRKPADVTFTSGATEANSWLLGSMKGRIVASAVEHPSVRDWATDLVRVDARGVLDLDAFAAALGDDVAIASVMAANNETGVIQPIVEVRALTQARGIPLHVDATQLPGKVPFDVEADFVTLTAHKFGGPKGVGVLVGERPPSPLLRGGSQERGRRAGTVNVPGIAGMGAAARVARERTIDPRERDRLETAVRALGGRVVGEGAPRLPNTSLVLFDVPGDLVVMALDLAGIGASTGSACSSGAHEPSFVLAAMGLEGVPVRFSLGWDSDVGAAIDALPRILEQLRAAG